MAKKAKFIYFLIFHLTSKMKKRFLHVCKNPNCSKEFAILHDKSAKAGISIGMSVMARCPHCKKLQKVEMPVKRKGKR